ncbi:MAG: hypothetical protein JOZ95_16835 [Solirubrobacterales bacterium]|nr:hypothetical protein [Solirubrobacterales bacterium]
MIGRKAIIALVAAGMLAALPASSGAQATSTQYAGATSDGGQWIADVPTNWNGTLLLYSHGFGPLVAADAPDPTTKAALLDRGYAMAGSSYDPNGSWWALNSALTDQFQTLSAVEALLPSKPVHVFAVGTSMGGLISALEDEHSNGRLDASLTTCGIVAGGLQLGNYQLDGEYAMTQLLNPTGESIQLVNFNNNPGAGLATGKQLDALADQAQTTPQGQARLALAMSLMNVSTWAPGQTMPAPNDYNGQEQQQYQVEFAKSGPATGIQTTMDFVEFGRPWIEQAAGGNPNWTKDVNFFRLLAESPYAPEIVSLYRQAGLNLWRDLQTLTRNANITADPAAVRSLTQTSVPTGRLQIPELDMHTISDQLVPVQQENYYRHTVTFAGRRELLRQAFVQRQLHCNFTPAELVAGVQAVQQRVETRHWDDLADPARLNAAAAATGLGDSAFIPYEPAPLSGDNGPFDPFTGGSFPFFFGRW